LKTRLRIIPQYSIGMKVLLNNETEVKFKLLEVVPKVKREPEEKFQNFENYLVNLLRIIPRPVNRFKLGSNPAHSA
jgi:hypothetical protein